LTERWKEYTQSSGRTREHSVAADGTTPDSARLDDRYSYDTAGNLTRIERARSAQTLHFGYDSIGRLREMTEHGKNRRQFRFDAGDNLAVDESRPAVFGPANRLETFGGNSYKYDAAGCLQSISGEDGLRRFQHDGMGQLDTVQLPSGVTVSFGYDPLGCRLYKQSKDSRTTSHWIRHRLIREIVGDQLRRLYVYRSVDADCPFMFLDIMETSTGSSKVTP
jgi:YD repeat-containing protein